MINHLSFQGNNGSTQLIECGLPISEIKSSGVVNIYLVQSGKKGVLNFPKSQEALPFLCVPLSGKFSVDFAPFNKQTYCHDALIQVPINHADINIRLYKSCMVLLSFDNQIADNVHDLKVITTAESIIHDGPQKVVNLLQATDFYDKFCASLNIKRVITKSRYISSPSIIFSTDLLSVGETYGENVETHPSRRFTTHGDFAGFSITNEASLSQMDIKPANIAEIIEISCF